MNKILMFRTLMINDISLLCDQYEPTFTSFTMIFEFQKCFKYVHKVKQTRATSGDVD